MTLAKWDDGYVVYRDPRREDPLFYYLLKDDWANAVGIKVEPDYNERQAKNITIYLHLLRPLVANLEQRRVVYNRALPEILKFYPNSESITLRDEYLPEMMSDAEFRNLFVKVGFAPEQETTNRNELVWRRS